MMYAFSSIALFTAAGWCYQYAASRKDEKDYPPPGGLVDIGGHKLHIQCQGEKRPGIPTVIVETGIWDCSESWQLVQSKLAATTMICTYDRAGYGWSEKGPRPRTFEQMALELNALLKNKDIEPPFIFVGHSLGGPIVRHYQSKYPEEVAGIVFVDALHKNAPEGFSSVFRVASKAFAFLAYFGALRLLLKLCPPLSKNPDWTPAMQKCYSACHQAKIGTYQTCLDEWEGYDESFKCLREKARPLTGIPITIISRDPEMPCRPGMSKQAIQEERADLEKLHRQQREDEPHARFVIAQSSSHLIQIDRPDVVVEEIQSIVTHIRK